MTTPFGDFDQLPADMRQSLYLALSAGTRFRIDFCEDPRIIAALHPYQYFSIPDNIHPDAYKANVFMYFLSGRIQGLLPDLKRCATQFQTKAAKKKLITDEEIDSLLFIDHKAREDPLFTKRDMLKAQMNHPFHKIAVDYYLRAKSDDRAFKVGCVSFDDVDIDGIYISVKILMEFHNELVRNHIMSQWEQDSYIDSMLTTLIYAFLESEPGFFVSDDDVSALILKIVKAGHYALQPDFVTYIDSLLWTLENVSRDHQNKLEVVCQVLHQFECSNLAAKARLLEEMSENTRFEIVTEEYFCNACVRSMFQINDGIHFVIATDYYIVRMIRFVVDNPEHFPWQVKQEVDDLIYTYFVLEDNSSDLSGLILDDVAKNIPETVHELIRKYCS